MQSKSALRESGEKVTVVCQLMCWKCGLWKSEQRSIIASIICRNQLPLGDPPMLCSGAKKSILVTITFFLILSGLDTDFLVVLLQSSEIFPSLRKLAFFHSLGGLDTDFLVVLLQSSEIFPSLRKLAF